MQGISVKGHGAAPCKNVLRRTLLFHGNVYLCQIYHIEKNKIHTVYMKDQLYSIIVKAMLKVNHVIVHNVQ